MSTKKNRAKEWELGDYVWVNKKKEIVGVINSIENNFLDGETVYRVAHLDVDGFDDWQNYSVKGLRSAPKPRYVVVWTDEDTDPMRQFVTKPAAVKFLNQLKKRTDVVECRLYKLEV